MFTPRTHLLGTLALLGWAGGLAGCGNIEPVSPHEQVTDPAQLFMSLTLDHRAINLSTEAGYNTIQLSVTPRDGAGAVMSGLPAATFRSFDTAAVHVSAEGLVTARQSTVALVMVVAEIVTPGPVRRADTAVVKVVSSASPPRLASFSIHPVPPDSAIWAMLTMAIEAHFPIALAGYLPNWVVARAVDTDGNPIEGLVIEIESLDEDIVQIPNFLASGLFDSQRGVATAFRPGQVQIVARTAAYGITKADTVTYTVTMPISDAVEIKRELGLPETFAPTEVRIAPHGMVFWFTRLGESTEVVFDDPTQAVTPPDRVCDAMSSSSFYGPGPHCGQGNVTVPALAEGSLHFSTVQARQFPVAGVYPYRDPATGATGRVVVTTDLAATP